MDMLSLKLFCRSVIESGNRPLPVHVQWLDFGTNLYFETDIHLDVQRTCVLA